MADYYPHPALKPLRTYPANVRALVSIERRICRRTIKALHAAGYSLRVHSGGEFETRHNATEAELMRALFNLDDAYLTVHRCNKGRSTLRHFAWVRFVFGGYGWDVISDYTTNIEDVLKPVNDYAEGLA